MIKIERSLIVPESLKQKREYTGRDVVEQLRHDFHDKCYICGIKPIQDPEIEHLLPHKNGKYPERKYDWHNLFWSCGHCNRIKNQSKYDKNVLDCCRKDPELLIDFTLKDRTVLVNAKDESDKEAVVTAHLVNDVFNKKNTGMRIYKCQLRVDELFKEMNAFLDVLEKYKNDKNSIIVHRTLKGLLDRKSPFAEYKRNYIRTYQDYYPKLVEFIE